MLIKCKCCGVLIDTDEYDSEKIGCIDDKDGFMECALCGYEYNDEDCKKLDKIIVHFKDLKKKYLKCIKFK